MLCPACKASMVTLELGRVEIDHCLDCGGVWLDAGELELLVERDGLAFVSAENVVEKKFRCPKCLKTMAKAWFDQRQSILIDRCARGHGIWLDSGELEAILGPGDPGNRIRGLLTGIFPKIESYRKGEPE